MNNNSVFLNENISAFKTITYCVDDEWKCTMKFIMEMHKQPLNKLLNGIATETLVLNHYNGFQIFNSTMGGIGHNF
jgi:hypothetical protein